jgi:acetyl esterase
MTYTINPHPDMRALIEARDALPPAATIAAQRANWTTLSEAMRAPYPVDMVVEDVSAPGKDGPIPLRVYRPASANGSAVLYFHGGGFMKGDLDSGDCVAWGYADKIGAVVISVDYRLTPEHVYPAAFDDCYGALEYVASNVSELSIDPARVAVAGDSAGGNLAAAVSLAARDRGGPAIAAQVLIYPMLGLKLVLASLAKQGDAPGLSTQAVSEYWRMYLDGVETTDNPYAAPLAGTDFAGLPPALIHTAEYDPLRDDGEVYAERLRAAGTPTTYRCAERMIHGFTRARFAGPDVAREFDKICDFLNQHLQG